MRRTVRRSDAGYRSAATTGPKPISWASPCAVRICSASSTPISGRAATASRWTAALLSTIDTTRWLMRRTRPSPSLCAWLAAEIAQCSFNRRPIGFLRRGQLETLLIRAMLIEAVDLRSISAFAVISRACAGRNIRQQTESSRARTAPAHTVIFIAKIPKALTRLCASEYPGIWPPKRTKCGQNVIYGSSGGYKYQK